MNSRQPSGSVAAWRGAWLCVVLAMGSGADRGWANEVGAGQASAVRRVMLGGPEADAHAELGELARTFTRSVEDAEAFGFALVLHRVSTMIG